MVFMRITDDFYQKNDGKPRMANQKLKSLTARLWVMILTT